MKGFYYTRLSEEEKVAYDTILQAVHDGKEIAVFKLNKATGDFAKVIKALFRDEPDLYYIDLFTAYTYYENSTVHFKIKELMSKEEHQEKQKQIENVTDSLLQIMKERNLQTDLQKCIFLYKWMVRNITYDYDALPKPTPHPEAYRMDGVFCKGTAVCSGIARAFKYLCDRIHVPCMYVSGDAVLPGVESDSSAHAWNIIKIDGKFTHVDVTWDISNSQVLKSYRYDYFGMPDDWMKSDHDYSGCPKCRTKKLNYFYYHNSLFSNYDALKLYLKESIKNKKNKLYFKIWMDSDHDKIVEHVNAMVKSALSTEYKGGYSWSSVNNPEQLCFCYKIEYK